jgi:hypothetical protein
VGIQSRTPRLASELSVHYFSVAIVTDVLFIDVCGGGNDEREVCAKISCRTASYFNFGTIPVRNSVFNCLSRFDHDMKYRAYTR